MWCRQLTFSSSCPSLKFEEIARIFQRQSSIRGTNSTFQVPSLVSHFQGKCNAGRHLRKPHKEMAGFLYTWFSFLDSECSYGEVNAISRHCSIANLHARNSRPFQGIIWSSPDSISRVVACLHAVDRRLCTDGKTLDVNDGRLL